jgi:PAS domain S-box-containing protein
MTRRFPFALLLAALGAAAAAQNSAPSPVKRFVYIGDADLAPFDYLDANGSPAGFNVELVRALARDAGVEIDIRLVEWHQARAEFDEGKADLIGMSYSAERANAYLWLARTWTVQQSILFRSREKPYPASLSELSGEAIAVQERSLAAEMLTGLAPPRPAVVNAATQGEAVRLLHDGVVSGVAGGSLVLRVAASKLQMRDFVELPLRAVPYGLVAAKGRSAEMSWVSSSLVHLRDSGTLEALAEKHLVAPSPPRTWWDYRLWIVSLVGVTVAALFLAWAWNRSLILRVKERTHDLETAMSRGENLMKSLAANEGRFRTFMALTSEGIARAELDEPLSVDRPEDEQIAHILKTARLMDCNRALAQGLRRDANPADLIGQLVFELVPTVDTVDRVRAFVRGGYRLGNTESSQQQPDGTLLWASSNAVGVVEEGMLKAIWQTRRDITPMKDVEADLRVRGRILEAVAFSSARLLEPGSWKEHIVEVLARLGKSAGVGCAYIFENHREGQVLECSLRHEWTAPGIPALVDEPLFREFPWPDEGPVRLILEAGRTATVRVRDLPQAGQDLLGVVGLKSVLIVPIHVGGNWWGLLGFGDFEVERTWSAAEIEALKTAGVALNAALLREQGEALVRASEKKHRDIVKFAPAGIYQARRDGQLLTANVQFARLFGYSRVEDVLSLNIANDCYVDPAERERVILEAETVGNAGRTEVRLKRRDGTPFWAELSVHPVKDAAGQSLYFEGFIQDISKRKAAEDELRASEERYRLLFDGNPVPMLVYDVETMGFLAANQAAVTQYGYSRDEFMQLSLANLASPSDHDFAPFVAVRLEPRPQLVRVGMRPQLRKDGSALDVDITSLAVPFAGRRARLLLCRDVTVEAKAASEREELQLALERAAEEWHRTFDAVDVAILVLDPNGRLTRVNRRALDAIGLEDAAVLAHPIDELNSAEPWHSASEMVASVVRTREAAAARAVDENAGGKTWELTAYPALAGQGGEERIILIVRDISRLVALQESLRRSETMSAMGSLVAGVAHEVRNPLFSISATVDALESELGDQEAYAELTDLLRSQVGRLRQLMRDLLDYGKPPALRCAPVHPREIIRRAARACATLAREREVNISDAVPEEIEQELESLYVDPGRMEQVFQNLIANAIQHTPRTGTVHAFARLDEDDEGATVFVVEDDGTGIEPDEIPRLFEPFFSRRKGGTGLGLSVVQRIVEAHGGRVTAANREGGGARFTVRLPTTRENHVEAVNG